MGEDQKGNGTPDDGPPPPPPYGPGTPGTPPSAPYSSPSSDPYGGSYPPQPGPPEMSGYPGQGPAPYAGPGQPPPGTGPGYPPGPVPGYAPGYAPGYGYVRPQVSASMVVLTVISGLLTISCYFTIIGIAPLVLGIMALVRNSSDPEGARRLTKIGWIVMASVFGALVLIGLTVGLIAYLRQGG